MSDAPYSHQPGSTPPPGFVPAPQTPATPAAASSPLPTKSPSGQDQLRAFALGGVFGLAYLRSPGKTPTTFAELVASSIAAGVAMITALVVLSGVFHTGDPDTSGIVKFLVIAVTIGCAVAAFRGSKRLLSQL